MSIGSHIGLDPEMRRRANAKAAALGISFAEYVRRLVAQDLGEADTPGFREDNAGPKPDISSIFDLGASDEPTDVARDKDKLIGEAVWTNYLRKVGRRPAHDSD
jgi:hypothetical protein